MDDGNLDGLVDGQADGYVVLVAHLAHGAADCRRQRLVRVLGECGQSDVGPPPTPCPLRLPLRDGVAARDGPT
jgi:hypothetical protein